MSRGFGDSEIRGFGDSEVRGRFVVSKNLVMMRILSVKYIYTVLGSSVMWRDVRWMMEVICVTYGDGDEYIHTL